MVVAAPPNGEAHLDPEEGSIQTTHSKKFDMERVGLTWMTVETLHWFMYPGTCTYIVYIYMCMYICICSVGLAAALDLAISLVILCRDCDTHSMCTIYG